MKFNICWVIERPFRIDEQACWVNLYAQHVIAEAKLPHLAPELPVREHIHEV